MKFVLDTNTLSFAMAGHPEVTDQLLATSRADVLVPQPVIAEILYGLSRLPNSKRRARLTERFEILVGEMLRAEWTDAVSRCFGETKADLERRGERLEDFDVAVAAHALALDATLVTDNTEHLGRVAGLRIKNWRERTG